MQIITRTDDLRSACTRLARADYVTVDTEFMRETTFWPKLCVIQLAGDDGPLIVDALAPGLELKPFFDLMADESVLKVFHAGRQDIEIVWHLAGLIPHPVFDTQVAAMVCGFGDSVSYDQLVRRLTGASIDKTSRFTDWSRRPLTEKQLTYAAADVTHLRDVYDKLRERLEEMGRADWLREEMEVLTSPATYQMPPENAWQRMKMRLKRPREIAVMMELAAWREREAQTRDVPRSRVLKDDAIFELAMQQPQRPEDMAHLRAVPRGMERSRAGADILKAVAAGLARDPKTVPRPDRGRQISETAGAAVELLKVLLRLVSESEGVATKIIATVDDLEQIAMDDDAEVPALTGWRRELFGDKALKLKRGELALAFREGRIAVVAMDGSERPALLSADI